MKLAKRILSLGLAIGMMLSMSVGASAVSTSSGGTYYSSRNSDSYVLNIYKDGTPYAGAQVRAYTLTRDDLNQKWLKKSVDARYFVLYSAGNTGIALASAGNGIAVMENCNTSIYGTAQHHIQTYSGNEHPKVFHTYTNRYNNKQLTMTELRNGGVINYQTAVPGIYSQQWRTQY